MIYYIIGFIFGYFFSNFDEVIYKLKLYFFKKRLNKKTYDLDFWEEKNEKN